MTVATVAVACAAPWSQTVASANIRAASCCTVVVNGPAVTMKVGRPGKTAQRTFRGAVGESITAAVTKVVSSDDGCQTVTLVGPGGGIVASQSACANGTPVGVGPVTLAGKGVYTVEFDVDNTATGSGKLWVSKPVSLGTVKVNRAAASMNVTRVGQEVEHTFSGAIGESVTAAVTNVVSSDDGCQTLTLVGPGGGIVTSQSACANGTPVGVGPVTLASKGTYTVVFELDNTATGGSTLWVSKPVSRGPVTVNGAAASMNVTRVGQGVERTFSGSHGETITAAVTHVVTSDDGCQTLTVFGPGGDTVGSQSACANGTPVTVGPVTLAGKGTYTVLFEIDNTATGSARLKVSK